jgi:hypothetical protein
VHDFAGKYNNTGYRAVPAFGSAPFYVSRNALDARFGESAIVNESVYGDYRQSVADGAQELAGYLQDEMTRCPSQLPIVGGFSQGAHVVGDAMKLLHERGQDKLLSRLGHVDLYGDPKFLGYEQATNRLNPLKRHVTMPWTRGSANQILAGSLGPRKPYVPDILFNKTTSWCDALDVVCGGGGALNVFGAKSHGDVYQKDGGYIEKSANEIFVDVNTRLGLLAGVTDKSANSPLAHWDGIKKPQKLDVVFVMDRTGDENISLQPDPEYTIRNLNYLALEGYSSFQVGVVTYTEFSRFNGTKDVVESTVKTPVQLTPDIFGTYSYFRTEWGRAHFQTPPYGGADVQDSPHSAIDTALNMTMRADARKVIVVFSNTWGKDTEDTTNITTKAVIAKARSRNVEILPVFTSKTFRANPDRVQKIPEANAFWTTLAKGSSGHHTEITDGIAERLLYDVIMGHVYAPDVEVSMGKNYAAPKKSVAGKKTAAPTTTKGTKPVVKTGKKVVLSASKTTSAKSKVTKYAWDLNGDGAVDTESSTPDVEHVYDTPFDGTVSVTVTDENGASSTGYQDIQATGDDSVVTHEEPLVLPSPIITSERVGDDVVLSWQPLAGDMYITGAEGQLITVVTATQGTLRLTGVPSTAFELLVQHIDGVDASETISVQVAEKPVVVPTGTVQQGAGSTLSGVQEQLVPSVPIVSGLDLQQTVPPNQQAQVLGVQSVSANRTRIDAVVDVPVEQLPRIEGQPIAQLVRGVAALLGEFGIRIPITLLISALFASPQALLFLLALLLVLLLVNLRDKKERVYRHAERYRVPRHVVRGAHYRA